MRPLASTVRVPGVFEPQPFAHRAYHATLAGKVEILVKQYQKVEVGDPLIRVESPAWRELQQSLIQRVVDIRSAYQRTNSLANQAQAVANHTTRLEEHRVVWTNRIRQIEKLGTSVGGTAQKTTEALAELSKVDTALAQSHEEQAQLNGERASLASKLIGYREATPVLFVEAVGNSMPTDPMTTPVVDVALERVAAVLGITSEELQQNVGTAEHPISRWRTIARVDFVAKQGGVVEKLEVTNGAWVETGEVMLTTVDVKRVRFRGAGLQSDLARLRDGLTARVLPPGGLATEKDRPLSSQLTLGLELDPLRRTIDLLAIPTETNLPHWARNGVSTQMEIVLAGGEKPQLAIPVRATIQDGLERVIFRRDPKNPDKVIRIPADLGIDDGRWVAVKSGLKAGDEVVAGGIYELMLASGGSGKQKGGHFHADGTFHEGDDH